LKRLIENGFTLEIAFKLEDDPSKRSIWETDALQKYVEAHLELPPANNKRG